MSNATARLGARTTDPCVRCDVLLGLDGVQVEHVERGPTGMTVTVSTPWQLMGCPRCGVVAVGRGRRVRALHDVPGVVPVTIRWRQRTWRCPDAGCPVGVFVEQHPHLVRPRGSLTCRAVTWAISQLHHEHATVQGLARQLGTTWKTLWRAVRPRLQALADDESRLAGVATLGVDEHVWHHTPHKSATKGPTMLTGMVDLTRDSDGTVHARLLDLVPGRSGTVFAAWLTDRTAAFRDGVQVATLDPFRGYANALRDELGEATPVLDAFHLVKLANDTLTAVRQRLSRDHKGRRGRLVDPSWANCKLLLRGADTLSERGWDRLEQVLRTDDPTDELGAAWGIKEQLRRLLKTTTLADAHEAKMLLGHYVMVADMPETDRLWNTICAWWAEIEVLIITGVANARTEAANTSIKNIKRTGRGFRNSDNYRARILLSSAARRAV